MESGTKDVQNHTTLSTDEQNCASLLRLLSHDLRNPLSNIISSSNYYLDNSFLSDTKKLAIVKNINTTSYSLLEQLENVFSISKLATSNLTFTTETLDDILSLAVQQLHVKLPESHVQINLSSEVLLIATDFALLKHAFMLIFKQLWVQSSNSCTLVCDITRERTSARLHFYYIPSTDSDMSTAPHEPHSVTDTHASAHDLSICKLIIDAHGGTLVSSSTKVPSAFTVTLPLKENC